VREVKNGTGSHKYSVFVPRDYNPSRTYPAIVFLHGIGEAGSDGKKSTTVGIGPAIAKRNGDFPFIVLFPQAGWNWTTKEAGQLVLDTIDDASRAYSIDRDRVLLTGMSSGGKGTWVLGARYPQTFAALVPMGGYAAYDTVATLVKSRMPIWALHNSGDFIVPVGGTRGMIKKLKEEGGNPRYTEFSAAGHNCWDAAYDEGKLFEWLQQQRRGVR
jgi:predicted peptidase